MEKAKEAVMENAAFIKYALQDDADMLAGMMGIDVYKRQVFCRPDAEGIFHAVKRDAPDPDRRAPE